MNVFVFTFGLTEAWVSRETGRVYPTAPGTIAGEYDPERFEFRNFGFNDVHDDFVAFRELVLGRNPGVRFLVTVSPVPLTATATQDHVLVATTYSKSVLRAVAGALAAEFPDVDYVPSYEVIATPWSKGAYYESNLRTVRKVGVSAVMRIFFAEHGVALPAEDEETAVESPQQAARRARRRDKRIAARVGRRGNSPAPAEPAKTVPQAATAPPPPAEPHSNGVPQKARRKKRDEVCEEILLEAFGT